MGGEGGNGSKGGYTAWYPLTGQEVKMQTMIDGTVRGVYDLKVTKLTNIRTKKKLTLKHWAKERESKDVM